HRDRDEQFETNYENLLSRRSDDSPSAARYDSHRNPRPLRYRSVRARLEFLAGHTDRDRSGGGLLMGYNERREIRREMRRQFRSGVNLSGARPGFLAG